MNEEIHTCFQVTEAGILDCDDCVCVSRSFLWADAQAAQLPDTPGDQLFLISLLGQPKKKKRNLFFFLSQEAA